MEIDPKIVFEFLRDAFQRGELDIVRLQVDDNITYVYALTTKVTQYAGIKNGIFWATTEEKA